MTEGRETAQTLRSRHVAALEWGEPRGIPTVLLHGFLDQAGSWSRVARGLDGWIVAPDLRGHGRSGWVGPGESYHFPEYVADLDALVGDLGGSVRLVGHSMGGTIASLYAGARPDRVERLVLLDGIGLPDGGAGARDRMIQFLDGIAAPPLPRPMASVAVAAARLRSAWPSLDEAWALALAQRGTRPVDGGLAWAYDPRHRVRAAVPYRQDQHLLFLAAIACPVLTIKPERSLFSPADVARVEGAIADLRSEILAGTGHMLQLDAPDAVAALVRAFLRAT